MGDLDRADRRRCASGGGRGDVEEAEPILKGRVIETLSTRFNSRVELDDLDVSVIKGLSVSGKGLRIYSPGRCGGRGSKGSTVRGPAIRFHAGLMGLFLKPTHVQTVHVEGLVINIPPKSMRQQNAGKSRHHGKIKIVVDEIVCDDSRLVIDTDKPDKDPKVFELSHIVLHDVGPNAPWPYDANLTNAMLKGKSTPSAPLGRGIRRRRGLTVTGKYTFQHADLNPIKGIGGILHSVGDFTGGSTGSRCMEPRTCRIFRWIPQTTLFPCILNFRPSLTGRRATPISSLSTRSWVSPSFPVRARWLM